jgi:hypothetical protein
MYIFNLCTTSGYTFAIEIKYFFNAPFSTRQSSTVWNKTFTAYHNFDTWGGSDVFLVSGKGSKIICKTSDVVYSIRIRSCALRRPVSSRLRYIALPLTWNDCRFHRLSVPFHFDFVMDCFIRSMLPSKGERDLWYMEEEEAKKWSDLLFVSLVLLLLLLGGGWWWHQGMNHADKRVRQVTAREELTRIYQTTLHLLDMSQWPRPFCSSGLKEFHDKINMLDNFFFFFSIWHLFHHQQLTHERLEWMLAPWEITNLFISFQVKMKFILWYLQIRFERVLQRLAMKVCDYALWWWSIII